MFVKMQLRLVYCCAIVAAAIVGSEAAIASDGGGGGATSTSTTAATAPVAVAAAPKRTMEFATSTVAIPAPSSTANRPVGDKMAINDGVEFRPIPIFDEFFEIIPCNLNDPHRNDCIKDLFTKIVPKLKDGLPDYGMPSIDPYFYRRGIFRYDTDGVQGGLLIKNMHINGISGLKVTNILSNFTGDGFIMKLNIEIPKIKANGHFKADVKFGGLRLVPKGPFNITIDNVKATILTDGGIVKTDAGRRIKLNRLNANVGVGNTQIVANGIFSDRNLNMMILNLVNENLPEITRVGIPATREQWAPILVTHINEFFANVPIDKILIQN